MVNSMRMNLKNKRFKKNRYKISINSKTLFIFLLSFSIVSIIIGISFYYIMSSQDKSIVDKIVKQNFTIKDNYNYLKLLKDSILSNTYNIFILWILGISIIGIIANIFIYFCQLFSIGFTIGSIISIYKTKGIIGSIIYLIPSNIIYTVSLFFMTYFSIKFSYKIIETYFLKKEINTKIEINKYLKVLIFCWLLVITASILQVFIDPFFTKLFTNI